jgi:hypothetical protein
MGGGQSRMRTPGVVGTQGRIGPFTPISRLDGQASRAAPVPENRYSPAPPDGDRTVLVSVPLPGANPERYMTEAEACREAGGWGGGVALRPRRRRQPEGYCG